MQAIVGLGGSAGSIGALQTFFTHMLEDSDPAFVVVLHLSPEYESGLAGLLPEIYTDAGNSSLRADKSPDAEGSSLTGHFDPEYLPFQQFLQPDGLAKIVVHSHGKTLFAVALHGVCSKRNDVNPRFPVGTLICALLAHSYRTRRVVSVHLLALDETYQTSSQPARSLARSRACPFAF